MNQRFVVELLDRIFLTDAATIGMFIVALWGVIGYLFLAQPEDRAILDRWLSETESGGYANRLHRVLDWIDANLAPSPIHIAAASRAWGWPLFDWALRFAVAYPFLLMGLLWAGGFDGKIGDLVVLPAHFRWWERLGTLLLLAGGVGGLFWLQRVVGKHPVVGKSLGFVLGGAVGGPGAISFSVGIAIAFSGAIEFARFFTGLGYYGGIISLVIVASASMMLSFFFIIIVKYAICRNLAAASYFLLFIFLLIGLLAAGAWFGSSNAGVRTVIVVLGVLPLVNGVFDFISIGATRWLMKIGMKSAPRAFVCGVADFLMAGAVFHLTGFGLIGFLYLLNVVSPQPMVDLASLFLDLANPDSQRDYLWLYLTIFSTFVPTFLHFSVSLWSLSWVVPNSLSAWLRSQIAVLDGTNWRKAKVLGVLTGLVLGTVAMPILTAFAVLWGIWEVWPKIGFWYLWVFETFAYWIGAAVEPNYLWV